MKHFFYILTLVILCACQTDDLLEEGTQPSTRAVTGNTESSSVLGVSKDGDSIITVGSRLNNPFSLTNMQRVLASIKAKDPVLLPLRINPGVLADLQIINSPRINASHYYIKITPASEEQFNLLKADTTLNLYSYPLDCEIDGEGVIPFESAEPDLADLQGTPKDPLQPLYASIPVSKSLPAEIPYVILENLYIPDEIDETSATRSGTVSVDPETAELWIDLSMYLTGQLTVEEVNENYTRAKSKWQPSGTIRVYDDKIKNLVPVPHAKVRTRRWFTTYRTYTDRTEHFVIGHTYRRPVNYSIAWESEKWDIRDGRVVQAFYNGPKRKGEWNLDINGGKSQRYATITRALYDHFYKDLGVLDRININRHIKIGYRHTNGSEYGHFNHFVVGDISLDIVIMGKTDGTWNPTDQILSTTFHELGHCAMFHKAGGMGSYLNFAVNIRESWAKLNQWLLTKTHYRGLGHDIFDYCQYTYPLRIVDNTVAFEIPCKYNLQDMNQFSYQSDSWYRKYTPVLIDLVDDSNQKEYYRIFKKDDENIYPDDRIYIKNYVMLNKIIYNSKTMSQLKQNLLATNIAPADDINDYFSFYGL